MRRTPLYLAGFILCALGCAASYGQNCFLDMQPRYYDYVSWSVDGTTITTTVQVSGYTQVQIEPGCSLNGVTHQGQVYNTISTAGGWVYGPSVWPPNSFTVTNTQTFTGTPGSTYTFNWVAQVYCSKLGIFWRQSGNTNIEVCPVPSTETTDDVGFDGANNREIFDMTLSDTAGHSFDNHYVQEATAAPGTNTCWWPDSGMPQNPGVQGGSWSVGTVGGVPEHNHWGYDSIGWDLSVLDNIVRNGPTHGVTFPCVTTIHQAMKIECDANTWWQYRTDDITITVDKNPNSEEACRDSECGLPVGFADRWTGSRFEWARILNSMDSGGLARPSPPVRSAKEARQQ